MDGKVRSEVALIITQILHEVLSDRLPGPKMDRYICFGTGNKDYEMHVTLKRRPT